MLPLKTLVLEHQPLCMASTYGLDVDGTIKYEPNHKDGSVYEKFQKLLQIVLKT